MNTEISVIIKARVTKFGIKFLRNYQSVKSFLNWERSVLFSGMLGCSFANLL